jgi:glucan-binding YG repeat protein
MKISKFSGLLLVSTFFSCFSIFSNIKIAEARSCDGIWNPIERIDCERLIIKEQAENNTKPTNNEGSSAELPSFPSRQPAKVSTPPIVPHEPTVPAQPVESEAEADARKELAAKELADKQALDRAKASNDRAKIIIQTLSSRSDVRNISLQTDPDRKLTGVCYEQKEFSYKEVKHDNANHPNAYADGYREGKVNAQKGEKYAPRSGGGEFSRGFDDGYYGKNSTGQDANATVKDTSQDIYRWNEKCTGV